MTSRAVKVWHGAERRGRKVTDLSRKKKMYPICAGKGTRERKGGTRRKKERKLGSRHHEVTQVGPKRVLGHRHRLKGEEYHYSSNRNSATTPKREEGNRIDDYMT